MKRAFRLGVPIAAIALVACADTDPDQREIAGRVDVSPDVVTLTFSQPFEATRPWTDVLLETSLPPGSPTPLELAQSAGLEATLVDVEGSEWPLQLGFVNQYVSASNAALHWRREALPPFTALRLRASQPIEFRRVVWLGYDPRKTKTGIQVPSVKADGRAG